MISALVTLRLDAISHAEEQVRGELAAGLLESAQRESSVHRAAKRGYPVGEPWHTITVECDARHRSTLVSRLRQNSQWLTTPLLDHGIAVLAPANTGEHNHADSIPSAHTAHEVYEVAGEHANIALFRTSPDLGAAAEAVSHTWQATRLARGLGSKRGVYNASILSPYATLFEGNGAELTTYISTMLGPVLEWDAEHSTQLLDTIIALFDHQWVLTRSAQSLHIHVNTIKQRIERIELLLGDDLLVPESRFRLELAARAEIALKAMNQT